MSLVGPTVGPRSCRKPGGAQPMMATPDRTWSAVDRVAPRRGCFVCWPGRVGVGIGCGRDGACARPACRPPAQSGSSWLSPCGWPPATAPTLAGFVADGRRAGVAPDRMDSASVARTTDAGWFCPPAGVVLCVADRPSTYWTRAGSSEEDRPLTRVCRTTLVQANLARQAPLSRSPNTHRSRRDLLNAPK